MICDYYLGIFNLFLCYENYKTHTFPFFVFSPKHKRLVCGRSCTLISKLIMSLKLQSPSWDMNTSLVSTILHKGSGPWKTPTHSRTWKYSYSAILRNQRYCTKGLDLEKSYFQLYFWNRWWKCFIARLWIKNR